MVAGKDTRAMRRTRLRISVFATTLAILAIAAWASAVQTGHVHVGIWIAILFVAFLLGVMSWAYFLGPSIYAWLTKR